MSAEHDAPDLERELHQLRERLAAEEARRVELERLVELDPLTGTLNRRGLERLFAMARAEQGRSDRPFALAVIDLDGLKAINDRLGHAAGDRVLKAAAEAMRRSFRATDSVARIGGDEFAVLLSGAEGAADRLEEFRSRLRSLTGRGGCGASIGVVTVRTEEPLDQALARADAEMYRDKRRRRAAVPPLPTIARARQGRDRLQRA